MGKEFTGFLRELKQIGARIEFDFTGNTVPMNIQGISCAAIGHSHGAREAIRPLLVTALESLDNHWMQSRILSEALKQSSLHEEIEGKLSDYLEARLSENNNIPFIEMAMQAFSHKRFKPIIEKILPKALDASVMSPNNYALLVNRCISEKSDLAMIEPSLKELLDRNTEESFLNPNFIKLMSKIRGQGTESLQEMIQPFYGAHTFLQKGVFHDLETFVLISFREASEPVLWMRKDNHDAEERPIVGPENINLHNIPEEDLDTVLTQIVSDNVPEHVCCVTESFRDFNLPESLDEKLSLAQDKLQIISAGEIVRQDPLRLSEGLKVLYELSANQNKYPIVRRVAMLKATEIIIDIHKEQNSLMSIGAILNLTDKKKSMQDVVKELKTVEGGIDDLKTTLKKLYKIETYKDDPALNMLKTAVETSLLSIGLDERLDEFSSESSVVTFMIAGTLSPDRDERLDKTQRLFNKMKVHAPSIKIKEGAGKPSPLYVWDGS